MMTARKKEWNRKKLLSLLISTVFLCNAGPIQAKSVKKSLSLEEQTRENIKILISSALSEENLELVISLIEEYTAYLKTVRGSEEEILFFLYKKNFYQCCLDLLSDSHSTISELENLEKTSPYTHLAKAHLLYKQENYPAAYAELYQVETTRKLSNFDKEDMELFEIISSSLDKQYEEILVQADKLFSAGLYEEGIALFQVVDEAISKALYPYANRGVQGELLAHKVRYRLVNGLYQIKSYENLLKMPFLLAPKSQEALRYYFGHYYILGLTYQHLECYRESQETLLFCTAESSLPSFPFYADLQCNIGLNYYKLNQYQEALRFFHKLENSENLSLKNLSQLYIAKILFHKGNYEKAESCIKDLLNSLPDSDTLTSACLELQGAIAYQTNHLTEAIDFFEKAYLQGKDAKIPDKQNQLNHIGWCHLKLLARDSQTLSSHNKLVTIIRARQAFEKSLNFSTNIEGIFGLANTWLMEEVGQREQQELEKVILFLKQDTLFKTPEQMAEKHLLLARLYQDPEQKEKEYQCVFSEKFKATEASAKGYYYYIQDGFSTQETSLETKIPSLQESCRLLLEKKSTLYPKVYFELIEALLERMEQNPSYLHQAFDSFKKQSEESEFLFSLYIEQYWILYAKCSYYMWLNYQDKQFLHLCQGCLEKIPSYSRENPNKLYLLASIEYQQQRYTEALNLFQEVAQTAQKNSNLQGSARYFATLCKEHLGFSLEGLLSERKEILVSTPKCLNAPEISWSLYSLPEYVDGNPDATKNLEQLIQDYPNHPIRLLCIYAKGLHEQKIACNSKFGYKKRLEAFKRALIYFKMVAEEFDHLYCLEEHLERHSLIPCIEQKYAALFQSAYLNMSFAYETAENVPREAYIREAISIFKETIDRIDSLKHFASVQNWLNNKGFLDLIKAKYALAKGYFEVSRLDLASPIVEDLVIEIKNLNDPIPKELEFKIRRLRGELLLQKQLYLEALEKFDDALSVLQQNQIHPEVFDIYFSKVYCHRMLGELDLGMKILSKIINMDAPIKVKNKALFYRAELYLLKGYRELALKQFALLKKRDQEWSEKIDTHLTQYAP